MPGAEFGISAFEDSTQPKSGIHIAYGGDALGFPPTAKMRLSSALRDGG